MRNRVVGLLLQIINRIVIVKITDGVEVRCVKKLPPEFVCVEMAHHAKHGVHAAEYPGSCHFYLSWHGALVARLACATKCKNGYGLLLNSPHREPKAPVVVTRRIHAR